MRISAVGDIGGMAGIDDYDASGFYVIQKYDRLKVGEPAELLFYRKDRTIDWAAKDLVARFPPDAIFSLGKWTKGDGVIARK